MEPFFHYECRENNIHAVFRALPPDVNEESQSAEGDTPSRLEAEKTMSATIPESTRNFRDIASFPDDK